MAHEFKLQRRVEFADTDMAGIVHFANFFRFMEVTEHAFFHSLGLDLHHHHDGVMSGWARVHADCDYLRPAHYTDLLEVHLTVREVNPSSIAYGFVFRKLDESGDEPVPGRELARGNVKVVHVAKGPGDDRMQAVDMPAEVAALVSAAPNHS